MRVSVTNAVLLVLALVLALVLVFVLLLLLRLTIESVTGGDDNTEGRLSLLRVRCWFAELRRRIERYSGRVVDLMPDASQEGKDGARC